MPKQVVPVLAFFALGLAACDDPKKEQQQRAQATFEVVSAEARRAAEEQVRARLRIIGDMRLRAVQVYRQQLPDTLAVCGQINPTGATSDPFVPWVVTVTLKEGKVNHIDLTLGASNMEATRYYIESLDRCFDGGGPSVARRQAPRALPPLPTDVSLAQQIMPPAPASATPSSALSGSVAALPQLPVLSSPAAPAAGSVTTTAAHPVNIRNQPGGGGAVVRIVPRASVLRVFGEAPGGWLQVGEAQSFGWVHSSMLER